MEPQRKRVTVLSGGTSCERAFSLQTAKGAADALEEAGYSVTMVDISSNDPVKISNDILATTPDVVFNGLHGMYGEDGCIQALLNMLNLPYTSSGVLASAAGMNKEFAKQLFSANGIPVASGEVIKKNSDRKCHVPRPHVIKPVFGGASMDLFVLQSDGDPRDPLKEWAFADDVDCVLVEEFIPGRELTAAVMGNRALGVMEIAISSGASCFDYNTKYNGGKYTPIVPANIPKEDYDEVCRLALKAHQVLGCRGISRTDLRYDDVTDPNKPRIVILEVNTQPGFGEDSWFADIAQYAGISRAQIVTFLVENACCQP